MLLQGHQSATNASSGVLGETPFEHQQRTTTARHLSPNFQAPSVPRHGSLPNVNAAMTMVAPGGPQAILTTADFPLVIAPGADLGLMSGIAGDGQSPIIGHAGRGPIRGGGHVSVRDSVGSAGPIRSNKTRVDTSPYGSERHGSTGNAGIASAAPPSYQHLSPPDTTAWRRVHSDSSIPQAFAAPVATAAVGHNGTISPLQGASPTTARKGTCVKRSLLHSLWFPLPVSADQVTLGPYGQQMVASPATSNNSGDGSVVQAMDQLSTLLDLPNDGDMNRNKPGSLPDLTNFHVNPPPAGQSTTNPGGGIFTVGDGQAFEMDDQGSPYNSVSTFVVPPHR